MRYPTLNKTPQRAISVPSLSGGLNLADSLHLVKDNQLTDVKNMWFHNSMLQTRPAMSGDKHMPLEFEYVNDDTMPTVFFVDLEHTVDGQKKHLLVIKEQSDDGTNYLVYDDKYDTIKCFRFFPYNIESECFFTAKPTTKYNHMQFPNNLAENTKLQGTGIFMIISYKLKENDKKVIGLCELVYNESEKTYDFYEYGTDDYYKPTVYINGKGESYSTLPTNEQTEYAPAAYFEGFSEYYKAANKFCFTTDGVSAEYKLPIDITNTFINIMFDDKSGTKWVSGRVFVDKTQLSDDGIVVGLVDNKNIEGEEKYLCEITTNSIKFETTPNINALNGFENNLIIEVSFYDEMYDIDTIPNLGEAVQDSKLFGASISKWFGGTGKGTRLFLSGAKDDNKNIVMWSKVNDPSYISENNYAYVGTSSQKITALHKQSDMLVVFKENELFYTQYTGQQEITASEVVQGAVVDVETNSTIFPFYQIHNEIGCDIPQSIQLCGSRLVWANKNKKVYTLKSANQYSNANLYCLSETIERRLKELNEVQINACKSCVYEGFYILSFAHKSFVLNIDNYYYKNTSAYADSRQQNRALEWFYWEFPKEDLTHTFTYVDDNGCHILNIYLAQDNGFAYKTFTLDPNVSHDSCVDTYYQEVKTTPIETMLQTKLFDFGLPDRYKKIEQVYIGFGETAGDTTISYVTNSGTKTDTIDELKSNNDDYSPEYVKTKRLLPNVNRAVRFGIKLNCLGRLSISDLIIKYKYIGGVR